MTTSAAQPALTWHDDHEFSVEEVRFRADPTTRFTSERNRFCLLKRPDLVKRYIELLADREPRHIVELGVFQGGSTALTALVARPAVMLAVESTTDEIKPLTRLLDGHGFDGVRVAYGRSQDDAELLQSDIAERMGGVVDLVIDDASHDLTITRRSFEILFPLIRPGGCYVIEDWAWAHVGYGLHRPDAVPLSVLVFELVLAAGGKPEVISHIHIDRDWAVIERGPADLADGVRVGELYAARGRDLIAPGLASQGSDVPDP
jgi:predicted O-methyltransferase YrrM